MSFRAPFFALWGVLLLGACSAPSPSRPESAESLAPLSVPTIVWEKAHLGWRTGAATAEFGGKMVLFGGVTTDTSGELPHDDLWEWDGTRWTELKSLNRPPARFNSAMATVGTKLVLFGGANAAGVMLGDTWEWDGTNWTQRTPATSPPARHDFAMASYQGKAVLFGGATPTGYGNDTWEWDGTNWALKNPATKPGARSSHAMATFGASILMFGGVGGTAGTETWVWDGTNWTLQNPTTRPSARLGHRMAPADGRVVLFGGYSVANSQNLGDTWEWDGATWISRTLSPAPVARSYFQLAQLGGEAVLYGGTRRGDLWKWNGSAWVESFAGSCPSEVPSQLAPAGTKLLAYNGETWEWDGAWSRKSPPQSPPARLSTALAPRGDRVVLFGGTAMNYATLNDTWEWDGSTWTPFPSSSIPTRRSHALASLGNTVVLFGGAQAATSGMTIWLQDTWVFNGTSWSLKGGASIPAARVEAGFAQLGTRAVLQGGWGAGSSYTDTWEFNGTTWTQRSPSTSLPPHMQRRTVLAPFENSLVAARNEELWEWDGTTWSERTPLRPPFVNGVVAMTGHGGKLALLDRGNALYFGTRQRVAQGGACNVGGDCVSGFCVDGVCCASACDGACEACAVSAGASEDGTCTPVTGVPCDDADACTLSDVCQSGVCLGVPVTCTAQGQCHDVGACNPATGICSTPVKPTGASCDDADPCTRTSTCEEGVCLGADPVTCAPQHACQEEGSCDPASGACNYPEAPDGTACSDDDLCTQADACAGGVCVGSDPITCPEPGECQLAMCSGSSGACEEAALPDGSPCSLGSCVGGTCLAPDAGNPQEPDAGTNPTHDGGSDAGGADGGTSPPADASGCGCSSTGVPAALPWFALLAFAARKRTSRRT